MNESRFNIAIETSSREGSVSLGRGDTLLETFEFGSNRRHAVDMLPRIDEMCRKYEAKPGDIEEVYVSVGPGSFTGLRVGVTTAKMLARAVGSRIVAVPTLEVVACNAPDDVDNVVVCLNAKKGKMFTGVFHRQDSGWNAIVEPSLMTPEDVCDRTGPDSFVLIGDSLPDFEWPSRIQNLDPSLATPSSRFVWQVGRRMADSDTFTESVKLVPLYVRLPEAEEVWRKKQAELQAAN